MAKIFTLGNLITLFLILIVSACKEDSQELMSISSEDKSYNEVKEVRQIVDAETGRSIYVITKK